MLTLTRLPTLYLIFWLPLGNIDILWPRLYVYILTKMPELQKVYPARWLGARNWKNASKNFSPKGKINVWMKFILRNKNIPFSLLALNLPLNYSLHCFSFANKNLQMLANYPHLTFNSKQICQWDITPTTTTMALYNICRSCLSNGLKGFNSLSNIDKVSSGPVLKMETYM